MSSSSGVPAAIAGFVSLVQGAVDPSVGVYDGIVRSGQPDTTVVVVSGWETTMREPASLGGPFRFQIEEQFDLLGIVGSLEGSEVQSVSRDQAFVVWDAVEAAVRTDPTLGGAVRVSWFVEHAGTQGPSDGARGNRTEITWKLHCEVRLT